MSRLLHPKLRRKRLLLQLRGSPVTAPMAGNIWKVVATEGQTVAAGDVLFILEAMKMETEVKAAQAGTVRGICVKAGDAVAVGDTVMTLA